MSNNNSFSEIGNAIKESLETQNFDGLNDAISQSVKQALDDAGRSIANSVTNKATSYGSTSQDYINRIQKEHEARAARERIALEREKAIQQANLQRARQRYQMGSTGQKQSAAYSKAQTTALATTNPYGVLSPTGQSKAGAIAQLAGGSVWSGISFSLSLYSLVAGEVFPLIFFGLNLVGGIILLTSGIGKITLKDRAKRFAQVAGGKLYADIAQLSSATGLKSQKVLRSLKKILNKGYYNQAYLDKEGKTLMLSDKVYNQYLSLQKQIEQQQKEIAARENEEPKRTADRANQSQVEYSFPGLSEEESRELNQMMNEGEDAVNRLHQLNDDIPGEIISQKLDRSENLLREIFSGLKRHPEQMNRMHKLMEYYLPTMMKLVEAYAEYDKVSAPGKEMLDAKSEIERTLDTINEAFEQLLNNLFQDSVWDVTTDAQVLKTMLANEGLSK